MKIRIGFVSNSSSSSYVCPRCDDIIDVEGWCDGNEYYEDEDKILYTYKGEVTRRELEEYIDASGQREQFDKDFEDVDINNDYDEVEEILSKKEYCPIYNLHHLGKVDMLEYLMRSVGINEDNLKADIRDKFKNRDEFDEFVK